MTCKYYLFMCHISANMPLKESETQIESCWRYHFVHSFKLFGWKLAIFSEMIVKLTDFTYPYQP